MRTIVTTDSVAQTERFDHWTSEMSKVFTGLDTRSAAQTPFHGRAVSGDIGLLQLSSVSAGPLSVRRTQRLVAQYEEDFYKVVLQVAGTSVIEQGGTCSTLGPGDLAICDTSRPYSFTYETDFSTVLMLLPRPMLPVRPEALRDLTARRIGAEDGVGAVVAPFLRSLSQQARDCTGPASRSLMDGTVSLVTALVTERLALSAPTAPQDAMMLRIRTYIEHRLSDPDLTPDSIAEAHGISRRYLFKLFAADGATVAGWIRTRRLERCARDLSSPAAADQSISMIAARWGLLDCRHFSRVFRTAYGETPRDFRRRALAGADQA
ncbi:helix-turn-helix domain-containing protein [Streptomyces ipomoeae]|uniref:Transcriptional regulator, AraC family n=2 Tax=Streptomyces ipomoeae TaxID=103232 RepID=L1KIZ9_9ACTN|nr:helix-turn-helix domain-containing protein [Streptomyces ipomoeae]EKX60363.1 transcriptional regulator, AraC family [Streptomyces ipomoeae 91-03]MDX2693237.1 helix-turn-helix domain-containing protein [Streptomyces ipomoeae]MDX2822682.1 helix-turn-helix domain-containing protein [Streptomyces ipomoeae]MDX2838870.1 helix-turn-helix domain-containing protein [Streptomyces ipomoeae]MDX2875312.1 helix-turn-helix domain-containing protein [Streptomyces ipomoeae]